MKQVGGMVLTSREQQAAVCKAILTFKNDINLSYQDLGNVLGEDGETWNHWLTEKSVPLEGSVRECVSHFLAIFLRLAAMFQDKSDRNSWLRTPHPDFELKSPLSLIMEGKSGLENVRIYLENVP